MADDTRHEGPSGVLGALLAPLRLPGRVVGDIDTLAGAVVALQRTAERHLSSIDDRAADLIKGLGRLQASVNRIDVKVERLTGLEATIESRMELLRSDLNTRMLAVEQEVHGMRPSIDAMAREVQNIVRLLPDPADGPLARLRDTLTSS